MLGDPGVLPAAAIAGLDDAGLVDQPLMLVAIVATLEVVGYQPPMKSPNSMLMASDATEGPRPVGDPANALTSADCR